MPIFQHSQQKMIAYMTAVRSSTATSKNSAMPNLKQHSRKHLLLLWISSTLLSADTQILLQQQSRTSKRQQQQPSVAAAATAPHHSNAVDSVLMHSSRQQ
jgi:hypothetical protein